MPKTEVKVIDMPKQQHKLLSARTSQLASRNFNTQQTTGFHSTNNQIANTSHNNQNMVQGAGGYQFQHIQQFINVNSSDLQQRQRSTHNMQTLSPTNHNHPNHKIVDRYEVDLVQLAQMDRGSFSQNPPSPKHKISSNQQDQQVQISQLQSRLQQLNRSEQYQFSPSTKMNLSSQDLIKPKFPAQTLDNSLIAKSQIQNSMVVGNNMGTIQNNAPFNSIINITNMSNEAKIEKIVETVYDSLDKLKFYFMCTMKEMEVKLRKDYTDKFEILARKIYSLEQASGAFNSNNQFQNTIQLGQMTGDQQQYDQSSQSKFGTQTTISQEFKVGIEEDREKSRFNRSEITKSQSPRKNQQPTVNNYLTNQPIKLSSHHTKQLSVASLKPKKYEDKANKKNGDLKAYAKVKIYQANNQNHFDTLVNKVKSNNNSKVQKPKKMDIIFKDNLQLFKQYSKNAKPLMTSSQQSELFPTFQSPRGSHQLNHDSSTQQLLSSQIMENQTSKTEFKKIPSIKQISMNSIIPISQETKHKLHIESKTVSKPPSFAIKGGQKIQVVQINKNSIFKPNSSPVSNQLTSTNLNLITFSQKDQSMFQNENVLISPMENQRHLPNSEKRATKLINAFKLEEEDDTPHQQEWECKDNSDNEEDIMEVKINLESEGDQLMNTNQYQSLKQALSNRIVQSLNQVRQITGPQVTSMVDVSGDFVSARGDFTQANIDVLPSKNNSQIEIKDQNKDVVIYQESLHSDPNVQAMNEDELDKLEEIQMNEDDYDNQGNYKESKSAHKQIKSFLRELEDDQFKMESEMGDDDEDGKRCQLSSRQISPQSNHNRLSSDMFMPIKAVDLELHEIFHGEDSSLMADSMIRKSLTFAHQLNEE